MEKSPGSYLVQELVNLTQPLFCQERVAEGRVR